MVKRKYSKPEEIDQKQWLIEIDDETSKAYAIMRESEEKWLEKCEKKGCSVKDLGRRRWLVQVPEGVDLPGYGDVASSRSEYAGLAAQLAVEQGKRPTVGSRTAELPQWINGAFLSDDPPPPVSRIRVRRQTAYRGGALNINDAIEYLTYRLGVVSSQRDNANEKYKHERVHALDAKLGEIEEDIDVLNRFLGKKVFARAKSGDALKINVKRKGEPSTTVSMPAVLLVPVARPLEVELAPKRAPRIGTPVKLQELEYFDVFSSVQKH